MQLLRDNLTLWTSDMQVPLPYEYTYPLNASFLHDCLQDQDAAKEGGDPDAAVDGEAEA